MMHSSLNRTRIGIARWQTGVLFVCLLLATLVPSFSRAQTTNAPAAPAAPATAPNGTPSGEVSKMVRTLMAANLSTYVPDDKYKLRIGDKVSLNVLEDRDVPHSLTVTDSGELDVPLLGRVTAADKTCKQLAEELKTELEKKYYYRATVVLSLDAANKLLGRVYVWGQVKNQGPLDMLIDEKLTAGKAILRAGGFGDFANKKKVKVVRAGDGKGGNKEVKELNMQDILENGKTENDIVLQPDDSIIVPSRVINF